MRILHAIHDFLPRHHAGSEIYAFDLCRELAEAHHVTVLCADYDLSRRHGQVTWRVHEGLPVIELVNNGICTTFEDTYHSPLLADRIAHVLNAVQPDVVHIHSLLNLSFDLPAIAHARGIPVVATLHDYSLVCPSGGQRLHRSDEHVCYTIDAERCVRCFRESPVHAHVAVGRLAAATRSPGLMHRAAVALLRRFPNVARQAARSMPTMPIARRDVEARLAAARQVFDEVDLFVAPSPSLAGEFERLGIESTKIRISDYGFVPLIRSGPNGNGRTPGPLRIGFVGTLVWHKGVDVLVEALNGLPPAVYELKIFGNLDVFPDYTAAVRARAAGLPVRFMGAFDRHRIADVYGQIDVLVVPSLWLENSPLVIHEAFMAGVPVVGARIGGIPDLVDDGRTGLLYDPRSPDELRAALRGLIENPQRLRSMAGLVRTAPRVKTIAEDAEAWQRTYDEVLGRRAAAGLAP